MHEQGLVSGHGARTGARSEDVAVPEHHTFATQTHDHPAPVEAGDVGTAAEEATPEPTGVAEGAEASHSRAGQDDLRATSERAPSGEAAANPDVQDAEETAAALFPTEFAALPSEEAAVHPASEDWQITQDQPDAPPGAEGGARIDAGILHATEPNSGSVVITDASRENTGITHPSARLRDDQARDQERRLYRSGTEATPPDAATTVDGSPRRVSRVGHYEAQQIVVPPQDER